MSSISVRAGQSVGTSLCITIEQTLSIADIYSGLLKRSVSVNLLLTSVSESTTPDKLLKFTSYMPMFGEKDYLKHRLCSLSDVQKDHPSQGVDYETQLRNISGLRLCPSRFEDSEISSLSIRFLLYGSLSSR